MSDQRLVRSPALDELRTFCVAADLGSLGRAAVRLHVSQPALTKRLQGLEALAGARLLERSPRGVSLTAAGRRLYEQARPLLEQADAVDDVLLGLRRSAGPVRLACSHSAAEAFVAVVLSNLQRQRGVAVELITANSQVVRGFVAEGRADLGVAAVRPNATPNPAVREIHLVDDEIVCGVPRDHPWALRGRVPLREFARTPVVVRDPSSNARWTIEAALRALGLELPPLVAEAPTPSAARRQALAHHAPLLLSRRVIDGLHFAIVEIEGLSLPRRYELVLPAIGEPGHDVTELIERLRAAVADW
ncbi:MAG TPA: LysR family transcriptional regulator [Solirubrobacteraceae bacterium]|nr:LysR family transcriptional regulator [Solirubrobacteraceae bacterium]